MARKLTELEAIEKINIILKKINKPNISFVSFKESKWISQRKSSLVFYCNIHKEYFSIKFISFIRNETISCPLCLKENPPGKNNIKDESTYLERINKFINNSNGKLSFLGYEGGKWIGTVNTKLIIRCNIHGTINYPHYYNFIRKKNWNCPECVKDGVSERRLITPKIAQEMVNEKFKDNPFGYDYSHIEETYIGYKEDVTIICPIHGPFQIKFYSLICQKGTGICPTCFRLEKCSSNRENDCLTILDMLISEKIVRQEKRTIFDGQCGYIRNLILDFYIPSLNMIIEYDGEQHYKLNSYFHEKHGLLDFVDQVNRDRCLERYCKENEIGLLRIPWKDNNRLEEVISAFVLEGKDITTKVDPILLPVKI